MKLKENELEKKKNFFFLDFRCFILFVLGESNGYVTLDKQTKGANK